MLTPEELHALLQLTLNSKNRIDSLVAVSTDVLCMMEPNLERCASESCKAAATVRHVDLDVKMCDYHAAACILRAAQNPKQQGVVDPITLLRIRLADEECWTELPNAARIRRLVEYVETVKRREEPESSSEPSELH